jgi:TPP-dependent pyruvate/acetoin dehydrogenase alpha subunit
VAPAWEFARESPYPDEKELLTDVFAGTSPDANTLEQYFASKGGWS